MLSLLCDSGYLSPYARPRISDLLTTGPSRRDLTECQFV